MSALDELYRFIDHLPDSEVSRLLAIAKYGEHKCHGSILFCCGTGRCHVCHVSHLRASHGEYAAMFWNKMCQTDRLTWGSRSKSEPANGSTKPKARPRSRTSRKEVNDPVRYHRVPRDLDIISAALARIAELRAVKP